MRFVFHRSSSGICRTLIVLALCSAATVPAFAQQPFSNTTIDFNEVAFPSATTNVGGTSPTYNVLNDATGAKLVTLPAPPGDTADLLFTFTTQAAASASATLQYQTTSNGRFTGTNSYNSASGSTNPGTRIFTQQRLRFDSHLTVTSLSAALLSLNTAGITWEFSTIAFLRPDGSYFSAAPVIPAYNAYSGFTGSPSQGWYVAADKTTVSGVGTATTAAGSNGSSDNLTLTYSSAGLAAGTQVGGIEITTWLEDVRGTGNGTTSLTSSFTDFTFSGTISAANSPEPATLALLALGAGLPILMGRSSVLVKRRVKIRFDRKG